MSAPAFELVEDAAAVDAEPDDEADLLELPAEEPVVATAPIFEVVVVMFIDIVAVVALALVVALPPSSATLMPANQRRTKLKPTVANGRIGDAV